MDTDSGHGPGGDFDPFAPHRPDGVIDGVVGTDEFVMVLRYDDLKAVTRDWQRFTSDAPFRVPIPSEHDVRSVRQLPIECDPPDHMEYRELVKVPFSRATAAAIEPDVRAIADELLAPALENRSLEVVRSFALPLQSRSLALMLGRSRAEADQWISWGTHVFRDSGATEGSHASDLDAYLDGAIADAVRRPGDDFFGLLATAEFRGRRLTREEMLGFANLTFAGGRDTVINAITNSVFHLASNPHVLERLRTDRDLIPTATEELLRYFSPLTHIGRIATEETDLHGRRVCPGDVVSLGFASANRDESVFERADECLVDRKPNRHIAFGHGPHTCLGAPLARMVMSVVLDRIVESVERVDVTEAEAKIEDLGPVHRQVGFDRLVVSLTPRHA